MKTHNSISHLFAIGLALTMLVPTAGLAADSANDKAVKDPPAPQVVKDWGDMTKCATCKDNDPPKTPKEQKAKEDCDAACKRVGM